MVPSSTSDTSSFNASDASVNGQPATRSSSFTPIGTPPKGSDTSASAAAARASSAARCEKALRSEPSMAARQASSASAGDSSLALNASTSEQASPNQGASAMGGTVDSLLRWTRAPSSASSRPTTRRAGSCP